MTDTNDTACRCRLGSKCDEHKSCGPDRWDHEWTRQAPFIQDTRNGYTREVTVYSCENCDWHDADQRWMSA